MIGDNSEDDDDHVIICICHSVYKSKFYIYK